MGVLAGAEVGYDGAGDQVAVGFAQLALAIDVLAFVLPAGNDDLGQLQARVGPQFDLLDGGFQAGDAFDGVFVGSVMAYTVSTVSRTANSSLPRLGGQSNSTASLRREVQTLERDIEAEHQVGCAAGFGVGQVQVRRDEVDAIPVGGHDGVDD